MCVHWRLGSFRCTRLTVQLANCIFSIASVFKLYESCNTNSVITRRVPQACLCYHIVTTLTETRRLQHQIEVSVKFGQANFQVTARAYLSCHPYAPQSTVPCELQQDECVARGAQACSGSYLPTSSSRSRSPMPTSKPPTHNLAMAELTLATVSRLYRTTPRDTQGESTTFF